MYATFKDNAPSLKITSPFLKVVVEQLSCKYAICLTFSVVVANDLN
jgi:hypothetical protein